MNMMTVFVLLRAHRVIVRVVMKTMIRMQRDSES